MNMGLCALSWEILKLLSDKLFDRRTRQTATRLYVLRKAVKNGTTTPRAELSHIAKEEWLGYFGFMDYVKLD